MEVIIEDLQDKIKITEEHMKMLEGVANLTVQSEGLQQTCEVNVYLTDDEEIRGINKEHRNIDKATDVLSFPIVHMHEGTILSDSGDYDPETHRLLLGDIIISLETAQKQAQEYGHSFEREFAFLMAHGMHHLLGYDHMEPEQEARMIKKQEQILTHLGWSRE